MSDPRLLVLGPTLERHAIVEGEELDALYQFDLPDREVREIWDEAVDLYLDGGRDDLVAYITAMRGRLDLIDAHVARLESEAEIALHAVDVHRLLKNVRSVLSDVRDGDRAPGSEARSEPSLEKIKEAIREVETLTDMSHAEEARPVEIRRLRSVRDVIARRLCVLNAALYEAAIKGGLAKWYFEADLFPGLTTKQCQRLSALVSLIRRKHSRAGDPTPTSAAALFLGVNGRPTLQKVWDQVGVADRAKPSAVRSLFEQTPDLGGSRRLFEANDSPEQFFGKVLDYYRVAMRTGRTKPNFQSG